MICTVALREVSGRDIVSVGDSVKVSILEVDLELKRIQLARVIGPHNV